jgi:hypothetical protein
MDDESKQFNLCSKGTTDRTGGVDERLRSKTSEALGFMAIPTASPSPCRGRTPHHPPSLRVAWRAWTLSPPCGAPLDSRTVVVAAVGPNRPYRQSLTDPNRVD